MEILLSPLARKQKPVKIQARRAATADRFRLKTILVPTDFSSLSQQAIRWAKFMAHPWKGNVHLVHVHDFEFAVPAEIAVDLISPVAVDLMLQEELNRVAAKHGLPHPKKTCHLENGRAYNQIEKLAKEIPADLIVTSTHGFKGLQHVLLGSTAERIVRHSTRPVLVARLAKSGRMRAPRLQKIVVPLDFSKCSERGLRYAIELARSFGARLFLLHIVRLDYRLMADGYALYAAEEIMKSAHETAEKEMRRLVSATDFGKVKFETAIETGSPEIRVCSYAHQKGADIIVTSTHGRTGLQHMLIGSVAEYIVRSAECPVLVVSTRPETKPARARSASTPARRSP
jgi:nucleotide-binding universal stress UspA family protein